MMSPSKVALESMTNTPPNPVTPCIVLFLKWQVLKAPQNTPLPPPFIWNPSSVTRLESQIKTTSALPPEASLIDAPGFAVKVRLSKPCIETFSLQAPETMRVFGPFGSRVLRAPLMVDKAPLVPQLTFRVPAYTFAESKVKQATK